MDPFEIFPSEILLYILSFCDEYICILYYVDKFWSNFILNFNNNKSPKILVSSVIQSISLMSWGIENNCPKNPNVCAIAIKYGKLEILKYLIKNNFTLNKSAIYYSVGYLEILKYIYELNNELCLKLDNCHKLDNELNLKSRNYFKLDNTMLNIAISIGNINTIQWLREHNIDFNQESGIYAVKNGKLEILKLLNDNDYIDKRLISYYNTYKKTASIDICNIAAKYGYISILEYAYYNNYYWNEDTCTEASAHGHLDCLKFLHDHGCKWNISTCIAAAANNNLECLQFLYKHGCQWNESTCEAASSNNSLECLQFLHEHKCPWDLRTYEAALENGHLECFKYAYENGCPLYFDNESLIYDNSSDDLNSKIINKNYSDYLKYAHSNGFAWDQRCYYLVTHKIYTNCLKNIHENERDYYWTPTNKYIELLNYLYMNEFAPCIDLYNKFIEINNFEMIMWLRSKNFPLDNGAFINAAVHNNLKIIKYLYESQNYREYNWNKIICSIAVLHNNFEMLKYVHENGCPWDARVYIYASINNSNNILEYADKHKCPKVLDELELTEIFNQYRSFRDMYIYYETEYYDCYDNDIWEHCPSLYYIYD